MIERRLGIGMVALIALLVSAAGLSAQAAAGVRAGANLASLNGVSGAESILGINAGGYFGFALGDRVALQLEGSYSIRGADQVSMGAGVPDPDAAPVDLRMGAVEIPILLRAGFPGERLLPSLFLGPYVSFTVSCQITDDASTTGDCDDESRDAWFSPRTTGYGLMAGGALDVALGESTMFLDVRYALGLASIDNGGEPIDAFHAGLTISGGFAFPLGR